MSPRPYRMQRRLAATEETRARIIAAARDLLSCPAGISVFTVEAVAHQANVARMTVYYQFQSKRGLVESLLDDTSRRAQVARLKDAFREPDPFQAMDEFISSFGRFWSSDRLIIRRLRCLGALDSEVEEELHARDQRRRHAVRLILERVFAQQPAQSAAQIEDAVAILHMLTSFETFDQLAGSELTPAEVVPRVQKLAHLLLAWNSEEMVSGLGYNSISTSPFSIFNG